MADQELMDVPDAETTAGISQRVRAGMQPDRAARAVGVDGQTFQRWMSMGLEGGEDYEPYVQLREAVLTAEADCEQSLVGYVRREAMEGNWQAAAWLAERRFPERYVRKSVTADKPVATSNPDDPFDHLDNVTSIAKKRS